jgi:hypothetical protein
MEELKGNKELLNNGDENSSDNSGSDEQPSDDNLTDKIASRVIPIVRRKEVKKEVKKAEMSPRRLEVKEPSPVNKPAKVEKKAPSPIRANRTIIKVEQKKEEPKPPATQGVKMIDASTQTEKIDFQRAK